MDSWHCFVVSSSACPLPACLAGYEGSKASSSFTSTLLIFVFAACGGESKNEEIIWGDEVLAISLIHHAGQAGRGP
jgi:hypothetical protein